MNTRHAYGTGPTAEAHKAASCTVTLTHSLTHTHSHSLRDGRFVWAVCARCGVLPLFDPDVFVKVCVL